MNTAKIRWVFFDVGDTLLDENAAMLDEVAQVSAALKVRGFDVAAAEIRAARERAYAEFAVNVPDRMKELLGLRLEGYLYAGTKYQHALERPFDGADATLKSLASRFRLGVIANQHAGTVQRLCKHGWGNLVSLCISSTEENLRKPDPRIFQLALERAGCRADEAAMVGDRVDNDITPAKAMGLMTIRVQHGLAKVQEPRSPDEQADFTVATLREIPPFLLPPFLLP